MARVELNGRMRWDGIGSSNEWNELLDWLIEVISEVFDRSFPSR